MSDEKIVGTGGGRHVCPACGAVFTGHFCPDCGKKVEEDITFCPVCGESRPHGKNFCANCGFSFIGASIPTKTEEQPPKTTTPSAPTSGVESTRHETQKAQTPISTPRKWTYKREGNYIYFGEYPQTIKADGVTITSTQDSRGYFLGSDGAYYAKVVADPYESSYTFSNSATVTEGTTYYFKVEPIRWRILSESDGTALILCDSILTNMAYDAGYDNNYAESDIRAWLNATFYNTAFTDLQKDMILTTTVDNSAASTSNTSNPYACEDTEDKVFLLSYQEATNSAYGFSTSSSSSETREMAVTDYARATGAYMYNYNDNGYWWLRSSNDDLSIYAWRVDYYSYIYSGSVGDTYYGVVPALQIRL